MADGTHEAGEDGKRPAIDETPLAGGAPEQPDQRWWANVDSRHKVVRLTAIGVAVGVVALAAGAAVTLLGPRLAGNGRGGLAPSNGTPTATAPATGTTVPGSEPTSTATSTPSPTSSVSATAAPGAPAVRAALVAYRANGAVWVSGEAGEQPHRVVSAASGPFALSPDGRTLATVDAAARTLSLVDVATGAIRVVGAAELEPPSWSRDSSFAVYTSLPADAHDTVVNRVGRDGADRVTLGNGAMPRVAPDGGVVAVSGVRDPNGVPIVVFAAGGQRLIRISITANAVAPATSTIAYCDAGSPGLQATARGPQLGIVRFDGTGKRTLVQKPAAGGSAFFGDVEVSSDGGRVVYAETGDDGYSRIFSIASSGGKPVQLTTRRDGYLVGFSADGTQVFYIDGNAVQGESTRLMAVHLDGTSRRTVVEGAGL